MGSRHGAENGTGVMSKVMMVQASIETNLTRWISSKVEKNKKEETEIY